MATKKKNAPRVQRSLDDRIADLAARTKKLETRKQIKDLQTLLKGQK